MYLRSRFTPQMATPTHPHPIQTVVLPSSPVSEAIIRISCGRQHNNIPSHYQPPPPPASNVWLLDTPTKAAIVLSLLEARGRQ